MTLSDLQYIPGIGPKRRTELLKQFRTISAIKAAGLQELRQHLPKDAAMAVYQHFHPEEDEACES